ncbi:ABC transporter ATP-binding protein [Streptomyces abyssomicinicus]|uniref:ABC transporter ATP-binding protein n=1 Tax=Streptomyces abyssomicinicus TaxID=574929 RepID=UPI001C3F826D|nr:ATP-binding cassette domain-containing protein [Streptomyces abyssomicinicus]
MIEAPTPHEEESTVLELDRLTRRFGERVAVDAASFHVERGKVTGFVGGNGAGKTTTMRMIMGVLAPTGGEVRWNGSAPTAADRRTFGYMPEERGLYPKQPVLSQLVYLGRLRGLSASAARASATALLDRFGLADRLGSRLESLSLGNQQRVQIAAALLGEPQLLVLDEPFSGLDPSAVDSMTEVLREFAGRGVPVLFSSHQLELVEALSDRLVILSGGKVVAHGTSEELRRRGPRRHVLVTGQETGWLRGFAGVEVVEDGGGRAVLELADGQETADALLAEALRRGSVRQFAELVPSVADVYREMTA